MRRVSSRQRLVSWDAFDATAAGPGSDGDSGSGGNEYNDDEDESFISGSFETAQSQSFHHSSTNLGDSGYLGDTDIDHDDNNNTQIGGNSNSNGNGNSDGDGDLRRRKRDRKSLCSRTNTVTARRNINNSSSKNSSNICKTVECPKTSTSVTTSTTPTPTPTTVPTIIPSYFWEIGSKPSSSSSSSSSLSLSSSSTVPFQFNSLIDDLHINIFSFLDLSSVRTIMSVSRHYRQLMMSNDARCSLWMDHCQTFWHIRRRREEGQDQDQDYHQNNYDDDHHHQLQPPPKFIDNCCLPIAATATATATATAISGSGKNKNNSDTPTTTTTTPTNLSLLLSLTPANFPTCVDQDVLKARMRLSSRIQQTIPVHRQDEEDGQLIRFYYHQDKNKDEDKDNEKSRSRSLVRYTGYVGQGDRCIRSNHPLPRPSRPTCYSDRYNGSDSDTHNNASRRRRSSSISNSSMSAFGAALLGGNQHFEPHRPFLMNLLRCGSKSMMGGSGRFSKSSSSSSSSFASTSSSSSPEWTPFVVPFVDQSSNGNITNINVTPRFVSYYEVSILKMDDINDDEEDATMFSSNTATTAAAAAAAARIQRRPSHRTTHTDCVAVGLATESFQVQSRMPGWDRQSFGYHGDDGGIFHSSGGMLKEFGPKYGPGDTVGCGIDYISKGIFYTLNGKFLGYAWKDLGNDILQTDLFPVVGLDTNCPIHLNFGTCTGNEAFQFDLSSFIKKHETIIASTYSYSLDKCSSSSSSSSCSGTGTSTSTTSTTTTAGTASTTTKKSSSTRSSSSLSTSLRRQRRSSLPGRLNHHRDRK